MKKHSKSKAKKEVNKQAPIRMQANSAKMTKFKHVDKDCGGISDAKEMNKRKDEGGKKIIENQQTQILSNHENTADIEDSRLVINELCNVKSCEVTKPTETADNKYSKETKINVESRDYNKKIYEIHFRSKGVDEVITAIKVRADSNCCFRSVLVECGLEDDFYFLIREIICDYVSVQDDEKKNPYKAPISKDILHSSDVSKYIDYMGKDKVYDGYTELSFLCEKIGIGLELYYSYQKDHIESMNQILEGSPYLKLLFISHSYFEDVNHYDAIVINENEKKAIKSIILNIIRIYLFT